MQPFVSIVIPTRNCEKTIGNLLESIRKLEYDNYEVIVVDSSKDKTAEIAGKYRVRIFKVPYTRERIANKQRNLGVKKARGKIVAFTDGDCKVHKNWLKELVKGFDEDVAVVGGAIKAWGDSFFRRYHQLAFRTGIPKIREEKILNERDFFEKQLFTRYELPVGMNTAIKRDVFEKVGYFDENMDYLEENELFWRILKRGWKIKITPKAIVYHKHADKLSVILKKYFKSGKGVGIFCRKYPKSSFSIHRLTLLVLFLSSLSVWGFILTKNLFLGIVLGFMTLIPTLPHSIRIAFKKRMVSALAFPLFDVLLCGFTYHLGIIYGLIHGK